MKTKKNKEEKKIPREVEIKLIMSAEEEKACEKWLRYSRNSIKKPYEGYKGIAWTCTLEIEESGKGRYYCCDRFGTILDDGDEGVQELIRLSKLSY